MEIRYSREMSHNYMIIEAPEEETGYASQMLSVNTIEGLLKFRTCQTEESLEYYYEITSRQPLKRILEKRTLSGKELRSLLLGILGVLKRVEEYLLKDEQILLDPEYIYIEPDRFTVNLCLIPGYSEDTPHAMSKVLEYLLERVDHQDREAVVLAYNLYQISLRENYGVADLMRKLAGEDKIFSAETKKISKVNSEQAVAADDERVRLEGEENYSYEIPLEEDRMVIRTNQNMTDDEPELKQKKRGGQWLNCVIRVIGCAAVAGIVYWYMTGKINIWLYAVSTLTGILAFLREYFAKKRRQCMHDIGNRNTNTRNINARNINSRKIVSKDKADSEIEALEKNTLEKNALEKNAWEKSLPEKKSSKTASKEVGNGWMIYPESEEEHKKELRREEEAQIERIKDAGTTLLSSEKNKERMARLEPIESGEAVIQVTYVPFTIGKHPELSDAYIDRPTVSRLHVRIDRKEGVYILTDLNSTNGTSVNGYQLQANETVSIGNGDSIYMADVGYKFWESR